MFNATVSNLACSLVLSNFELPQVEQSDLPFYHFNRPILSIANDSDYHPLTMVDVFSNLLSHFICCNHNHANHPADFNRVFHYSLMCLFSLATLADLNGSVALKTARTERQVRTMMMMTITYHRIRRSTYHVFKVRHDFDASSLPFPRVTVTRNDKPPQKRPTILLFVVFP